MLPESQKIINIWGLSISHYMNLVCVQTDSFPDSFFTLDHRLFPGHFKYKNMLKFWKLKYKRIFKNRITPFPPNPTRQLILVNNNGSSYILGRTEPIKTEKVLLPQFLAFKNKCYKQLTLKFLTHQFLELTILVKICYFRYKLTHSILAAKQFLSFILNFDVYFSFLKI